MNAPQIADSVKQQWYQKAFTVACGIAGVLVGAIVGARGAYWPPSYGVLGTLLGGAIGLLFGVSVGRRANTSLRKASLGMLLGLLVAPLSLLGFAWLGGTIHPLTLARPFEGWVALECYGALTGICLTISGRQGFKRTIVFMFVGALLGLVLGVAHLIGQGNVVASALFGMLLGLVLAVVPK